jgi:7-cyano-7-deazaguanine synthase
LRGWKRSASITASGTRASWRRAGVSWRRSELRFPQWADKLGEDHLLTLDVLKQIGGSALTDAIKIEMGHDGLPTSFVPGRNVLFLTAAAALGYRRGIADLIGGMCETDFSGYPDCREKTMIATAEALTLALDRRVTVHTPLMAHRQGGHLGAGATNLAARRWSI